MSQPHGGIIHAYQKFDPANFPSPTQPPPDLVSPDFDHALMYGDYRELSEEELSKAIRLDPSQIAGLGPSLDMLRAMLEDLRSMVPDDRAPVLDRQLLELERVAETTFPSDMVRAQTRSEPGHPIS
jgi:hypothetical protein